VVPQNKRWDNFQGKQTSVQFKRDTIIKTTVRERYGKLGQKMWINCTSWYLCYIIIFWPQLWATLFKRLATSIQCLGPVSGLVPIQVAQTWWVYKDIEIRASSDIVSAAHIDPDSVCRYSISNVLCAKWLGTVVYAPASNNYVALWYVTYILHICIIP
jgi:hypothetical protein